MNNLIRKKPVFGIGMTAIEVVAEIVRVNPEIARLAFMTYIPLHKSKKNLLLEDMLFHRPAVSNMILYRYDITGGFLWDVIRMFHKDCAIGLLSRVNIQGENRYIPMMDFKNPDCPNFLDRIKYLIKLIGHKDGVILSSGRSYHYYSAGLMEKTEWLGFLGDCLLSGLADPRYIGHANKDNKDGCNVLRISSCSLRPETPHVVSILD